MHRRIRQVFTSLKEHSCVSYAKIATIGGFCDIDLTIVKATSPDDFPLHDRYVHQFLKVFSISPSTSNRAFALSFSRRFAKTRSWRVALKCLVLLHRLLRSLPDDSRLRTELLWARTQRFLSLYPCNFSDCSSSASKYYTAFVRSYARLLDESITCVSPEILEQSTDEEETLTCEAKDDMGRMIETLPQLQSLTDRCIDCRPATGEASRSFLVQSAMKHIIRDSFMCYATFKRQISIILDNMIQLPYRSSLAAFGIYKKASFQAEKLSEYHDFCKTMGYCGSYEYPLVERIPEIQIQALETFLNGMWSFTSTDQSSNYSSTLTSYVQSPLSFTDHSSEKRAVSKRLFDGQVVEKDTELEPLIKWHEEDEIMSTTSDGNWEDLLEASISTTPCMEYSRTNWQMEVYDPYVLQTPNPFYQPHRTNFFHGSCPNTPIHSWGL
ncbi:putative clathrin assembly protein At2g01600 [Henckelia pumila]|uniref:putative clathrin assembly protein At2g01600 n=1 Tax=Henckelia pumila TaxID=405737 RepID=UPI003C6E4266